MKRSSFVQKIIFAINLGFALLLLIMAVLSFLFFQPMAALAVLSLVVPLLIVANLFFLLYWLYMKKGNFLVSLIVLLIAFLSFGSFYRFGGETPKVLESDLKLMTYNVWGFNKNEWIKRPNVGDQIVDFVKREDPDILCVQEHSRVRHRQLKQFPYRSETPYSAKKTIQAIFSKYPIIGEGSLDLPGTINNIIFADIVHGKDTIRVYNVHLQSFSIIPSTASFSDGKRSERTYHRLVSTFKKQMEQARIFRDHLESSPYVNVVGGDFNNTQFSNIYKIIKGDLQDSFLQQGDGFGATYKLFRLPIRIDYIMADPSIQVIQHQNYGENLSDHYPVMARLRLPSHQ